MGALIGRKVLGAYKNRPELAHGEDAGRGRGAQDLSYLILCYQSPQENPRSPMEEPLEPWDTKVGAALGNLVAGRGSDLLETPDSRPHQRWCYCLVENVNLP